MAAGVEKSFWIAASPEAVFDLYTNGAAAKAWLGLDLEFEARPGGRYRLDMQNAGIVEGQVLECERPRFIHHTVADIDGQRGSQIRLTFEEEGGGTRVLLHHSGLADERGATLAGRTWDHHLARIAVAASGGMPGPDPMLRDLVSSEF